jgi:hypothetical protein
MSKWNAIGVVVGLAAGLTAASGAQAAKLFQIETSFHETPLTMTPALDTTSTTGRVLAKNDFTVTTNANANFTGDTITPAGSALITSVVFTPANPIEFTDFAFRGEQLFGGKTFELMVTDQNGATQDFSLSAIKSRQGIDAARSGIWIKSVDLVSPTGFKLVQELSFGTFSAPVPEPGAWAMLIVGFAGMGGLLRRSRAKTRAAIA